ncbi:hypothetical protein HYC85_021249 [Camellia sinensis]|uniref:Uncharacterized protein n=1 Tax=Camellia sinensis TaxID=4442 RepID=A0A7J7GH39_CAMSI|nr:hypothetical protein HYC85_021249 [Camellia sinensis]
MAFLLPLLTTLFVTIFASDGYAQSSGVNLLPCSKQINTCTSLLYQHNNISKEQISTFYSFNTSQISPIVDVNKHTHYVVTALCSCKQVNSTSGVIEGYFYSTVCTLQPNDMFVHVSDDCYSGQAWKHGGEEGSYQAGEEAQIDLLCGCLESESQIVMTYTVQLHDTLSESGVFGCRLGVVCAHGEECRSTSEGRWDSRATCQELTGSGYGAQRRSNNEEARVRHNNWHLSVVIAFLAICILRISKNREKDPNVESNYLTANKFSSSHSQNLHEEKMEGTALRLRYRALTLDFHELTGQLDP